MTRDHLEALEERVSEFAGLAEVIGVIKASTTLDVSAAEVLSVIHLHLLNLTNRLDELTVPARRSLGSINPVEA
jgi:hypothetical protein